ncbi:MAG: ABC transporter ATP-binding protein [Acidimicrobiia bacterium]
MECHDLTRWHPGGIVAVRDVTLSVNRGELIAITGPSGSGKTSLLAMLGLLDKPNAGVHRIMGVDATKATERERARIRSRFIGFVFQSFHLLPARTALENVAMGLLYSSRSRGQRLESAREALMQFGLCERIHSHAGTLSGGEQQRVAIARALVGEPEVLLCDEPTGNLDTRHTTQLLDVLVGLNRAGLTIVIVTHDRDVAAVAGIHYEMTDGNLEMVGADTS